MTDVNFENLSALMQFVDQQYDLIADGSTSHGQALYNIADYAEQLNEGNYSQAIRDMTLVIIGDDVSRPNEGRFRVAPEGRINGADGFKSEFRDESAQIIHAVAGLYMSFEYGTGGTIVAIGREVYTNFLRGRLEAPDYALFLATEAARLLVDGPIDPIGHVFSPRAESLAEAIRQIVLDDSVLPNRCFLPHTPILLADGTSKPIAAIRPGDMVLSHDKGGTLVPARVTRTFVNDVAHVLDFHGTGVTPGHAFLCGAGRFQGRHVPLLDILRDDGAVVRQDGSLMRVSTGCAVGSDGDRRIEVVAADGATGWVRAATRLPGGATVAEAIAQAGGTVCGRDAHFNFGVQI